MAENFHAPLDINELIDAHNPALLRIISPWARDGDEAEDILQEVWIKVHQNLHKFRGDSAVFTWLYRIAINTAINFGRKRKYEIRDPDGVPDRNQLFQPEKEYEKNIVRSGLADAIAKLAGRYREIFLLRAFDEMPYEEIGRRLKITAVNARVMYHHAVQSLRKTLDGLKGY